jgi:hypothetical protein
LELCLPIRITLQPPAVSGKLTLQPEPLSIIGETRDMSETGISFVVPAVRIREHYLVAEERTLLAEVELPDGRVSMTIQGLRYDPLEFADSTAKYLIGAAIRNIQKSDLERYREFLKHSVRKNGSKAAALQLNITKS